MIRIDLLFVLVPFVLCLVVTIFSFGIAAESSTPPDIKTKAWRVFRWAHKITIPFIIWLLFAGTVPFVKTPISEQGEFPVSTVRADDGSMYQFVTFPKAYLTKSDSGSSDELRKAVFVDNGVDVTINVAKLEGKIIPPNSKIKLVRYSNEAYSIIFYQVTTATFEQSKEEKPIRHSNEQIF